MGKIPDRWLNYIGVGKQILGTRFIAFKVPLSEAINEEISTDRQLHPKLLLEKIPNLGLIIDLTNTYRYYNPEQFKSMGVEHSKILIEGHVLPKERQIDQFMNVISDFLANNFNNDKLIGVHCTHGINRTGFMLCNYMIKRCNMKPKEAIKNFNEARGYDMERINYVNFLRSLEPATFKIVARSQSSNNAIRHKKSRHYRGNNSNYQERNQQNTGNYEDNTNYQDTTNYQNNRNYRENWNYRNEESTISQRNNRYYQTSRNYRQDYQSYNNDRFSQRNNSIRSNNVQRPHHHHHPYSRSHSWRKDE